MEKVPEGRMRPFLPSFRAAGRKTARHGAGPPPLGARASCPQAFSAPTVLAGWKPALPGSASLQPGDNFLQLRDVTLIHRIEPPFRLEALQNLQRLAIILARRVARRS